MSPVSTGPRMEADGFAQFLTTHDVDILFTGKNSVLPSSALNENYITNFSTLRSMGDKLVNALASNLGLGGSTPTTTSATMTTTAKPTPTGCSWPGHCQGGSHLRSCVI